MNAVDAEWLGHVSPERHALYVGIDGLDNPDLLLGNAERVADRRLDDPVLDYLYERAREPRPSRQVWIREALVSSSFEFILEDFFTRNSPYRVRDLFDPAARAEAARRLSSPRGMLALTFHGGYGALSPHLFADVLQNSLIVEVKSRGKFRSVNAKKSGAALFAALRVLREGGSVYLTPEGPFGKRTGKIEVLGASLSVSDGAAFLAYETGCETGWYVMRRDGQKLVPVIEPGPSRDPGDTYADFRSRLFQFYRDRIEEQLTGDPRNLALHFWWRGCAMAGHGRKVFFLTTNGWRVRGGASMTRDEVRATVRDILADLVDDPELVLADDTTADDVADWDSINHVRLLIALEEDLGFRFTNEEAEGLSNVGELVDLVQRKLNGRSAGDGMSRP